MPEQSSESWLSRNWKWMLPCGCVLPVLLCGGFISMIVFGVFSAIKSAGVYTDSLGQVQADPVVQAELGEPIEPGFFVMGNIEVSGPSGNADISYSVSGPKGSGTVYVVAEKNAGEWTFSTLAFKSDATGERIDLLANP